jgi:hypothetical protein
MLMSAKKTASRQKIRTVRVGDRVSFRFAGQKRIARIIEDRGNIGVGGRRLIRVVFVRPHEQFGEPFELPADAVSPVAKDRVRRTSAGAREKVA